jgi:hypothetical protein
VLPHLAGLADFVRRFRENRPEFFDPDSSQCDGAMYAAARLIDFLDRDLSVRVVGPPVGTA